MAVHNPVGICTTIAIVASGSLAGAALDQQSNTLRLTAVSAGAHIGIGSFPVGYTTSYYVAKDTTALVSLGPVFSQRVTGVSTSGTTTILSLAEGGGSQFRVNDAVSFTSTNKSDYDFSHKIVTAVSQPDITAVDQRATITVDNDYGSYFTTAWARDNSQGEVRNSFKVAALGDGTGTLYYQQVQVTGDA